MLKQSKKYKQGKKRRHFAHRSRLNSPGFGCPWSDEAKWFRVEFSYLDPDTEEESNFQTHWIACRRFKGEERRHLCMFVELNDEKGLSEQTLEARYVCIYVAAFVCSQVQGEEYDCPIAYRKLGNDFNPHINQAFVFPAAKKNDNTIRYPLYRIIWGKRLCAPIHKGVKAALNNCIRHEV